jgi:pyrroloquinoline quinone biosynthesis protein B
MSGSPYDATRRQLLKNSLGLAAASAVPLGPFGPFGPFGPQDPARSGQPAPSPAPSAQPFAVVLGTSQDGGVPQANCFTGYCARVRSGEVAAPRVACLGIVDPATSARFLIDATPDFVAQVGDLVELPRQGDQRSARTGTLRLEDELQGILLTHAHMGHYTGLLHCGREAAATDHLPVYASTAMTKLLRSNQPFKTLIDEGRLDLKEISIGTVVELTPNLSVTPLSVVHRAELTDTVGLLINGPSRSLMYVPDADRWAGWPVPFGDWLDKSDIAVLDGTFYSAEELGHRWQGEVPHPPVADTVEALKARAGSRPAVWFTHLNHTNPLWEKDSAQRAAVEDAGFGVAQRGQIWEL